jgi:glycyl-tRNA synthetase
MFLKI